MNTNSIKHFLGGLFLGCSIAAVSTACSDWDDHYDETTATATEAEVYGGDIVSYVRSASDLTQIADLFSEAGVLNDTRSDGEYTFVVCDNTAFAAGNSTITDKTQFANYCVADVAITPSQLVDGFGINNRAGKTIWVYGSGSAVKIDDYSIKRTVKTANGYVYYIDGVLPVRLSVYEYLKTLGGEYSTFRSLVEQYEQRVFDREHSQELRVNQAGEIVYDSVWITRHTLMDRYTNGGIDLWNMRDEQYTTTMFIPTNDQIEKALSAAYDSIPVWLNRQPVAADSAKFEEWIVRACFSDNRLEAENVNATAGIFKTVGGYKMVVDELRDETTYVASDDTYWKPSVQTVDVDNRVNLSNGYAYFCTDFKIPNHVVIYRVKTRFYQIWDDMDDTQRDQYFTLTNIDRSNIKTTWAASLGSYDKLYPYGWPIIDYNILAMRPTEEATADSLTVGVEYYGLIHDESTGRGQALECNLPAGEYNLCMGFDRNSTYSISISFNDSLVWEGRANVMNADRVANDIPTFGDMAPGYPEGYDPNVWIEYDHDNASAYDTDGYHVGYVMLSKNGNFRIRVESADLTPKYIKTDDPDSRWFCMYHWCLRPTPNNY